MEFRILGPLEVRSAGHAVPLPGAKPRAVLAMLLLHANRPVGADRIAQALWGEDAPAAAANTVQVHVSRLRKALGDDAALVTTAAGYELRLEPRQLDAERLADGLAAGRAELAAGRPEAAAAALESALAEWRGPPLADLAGVAFADRERARLEELRVAAWEELVEARLALGRHAEVAGQLDALIAEHPYRERLRAQLMLALYRGDRQADALQAYQDARRALVEELGIEPGERLRELERAVLAQDPALAGPRAAPPAAALAGAGRPAAAPPPAAAPHDERPARRQVSVLCAGVASADLDPEVLDALLDRLGAVIERHGGSVENVSGDMVIGAFGLAELHEDDALRAVRAARELHDSEAQAALKLGIESGEVFVGGGARRASGEVFTRAAALQAAAAPGDTMVGERAQALVTGAQRPRRSAFVDRAAELEALRAAFAEASEARACRRVSVIGPAGIGKSRLAHELAAGLDATVLTGGCPSYGEGVTYRPLAEIVGRLGGREGVEALLGDGPAAQKVLAAAGLSEGQAQAEETFWAVRRLLEAAAERPLVVVLEDLHWAEPTLLDLVDYLAVFSSGHPILLVCVARPELLEARPSWAAPGQPVLVLDPLPEDHARTLVAAAGELAPGAAERIVETAEGNPLFLEQLIAVGAGPGELPSSIQAVLAARLARLEPGERALLEDASVQGRTFYVAEEFVPDVTAARVLTLVQRQLIRPDRSELPGRDAFGFSHALIREAAYRNLPRQRRAQLHEAAAHWLDAQPGAHDETVGHHLAEAHAARAALGEPDPALATAAAERLAVAAEAALLRGDPSAGARLLERAASLREDGELLPALGAALFEAGRVADAARVLEAAAGGAHDPRQRARALVELELVRLETDPAAAGRVPDTEWAALDGDVRGECRVGLMRGRLAWDPGRVAEADTAWARAGTRAEEAGLHRQLSEIVGWRAVAAALGPLPADSAIRRLEGFRALVQASPIATASVLNPLAYLHAMRGDLARAEALLAEAGAILAELAGLAAGFSHLEAFVRLLAGQPERAEALLRDDVELLSAMVEGSALATTTALLARAVLAQGRTEEAGELALEADRRTAPEDTLTQALWRGVRAHALAHAGRHDEALALAHDAVALLEPTDLLSHRGDAMLDLAAVLAICERREESERAVRSAVGLFDRKGNAMAANRARQFPFRTTDQEVGDVRQAEHSVAGADRDRSDGSWGDRRRVPAGGDLRRRDPGRRGRSRPVARLRDRRPGRIRLEGDAEEHDVPEGRGGGGGRPDPRRPVPEHLVGPVAQHHLARHGHGPDLPPGRFGVLVPGLKPCKAGEPEIEALVKAMRARAGITQGTIPAGFTYLGQFIDHDITFDPTPFGARSRRPRRTVNHRTPRLDLDSLYGGGPDVQPYLYEKLRPERLLLHAGPPLDLPRNDDKIALTGDPRNDENAIVSQLHLLFARFHNRVADEFGSFTKARRIVLRHYHWIVLDEYLPAVLGAPFKGPRKHYRPTGEPFIPVEFSGAAFRFGHSMVRPDYGTKLLPEDENTPGPGPLKLFPDLEGFRALESVREIAWERFFKLVPRDPQDSSAIDTRLAPQLFQLPFGEPVLARRTLLRGIKLKLPSGQALASKLGVPALDEKDLRLEKVEDEQVRESLIRSTPLWYWILCEAEKGGGFHLGPLGRLIVGEVLVGLIETDPTSFVNAKPGWKPGVLGGTPEKFSMASLVRFARGEEPE